MVLSCQNLFRVNGVFDENLAKEIISMSEDVYVKTIRAEFSFFAVPGSPKGAEALKAYRAQMNEKLEARRKPLLAKQKEQPSEDADQTAQRLARIDTIETQHTRFISAVNNTKTGGGMFSPFEGPIFCPAFHRDILQTLNSLEVPLTWVSSPRNSFFKLRGNFG